MSRCLSFVVTSSRVETQSLVASRVRSTGHLNQPFTGGASSIGKRVACAAAALVEYGGATSDMKIVLSSLNGQKLRRHWAEGTMSSVTVQDLFAQRCFARCAWHGRRSECWARRTTAKELAPRLDDTVRDASRSTRFHVATHPDAKRARLPPSSPAARVLLRILRAPPFAVRRQHQRTTRSRS